MDLIGPKIRRDDATELAWRVHPEQFVQAKQVIGTLVYETPFTGIRLQVMGPDAREKKQFAIRASCTGKVLRLAALEEYHCTGGLGELQPCLHEHSFGGLCTQCGFSVEQLGSEVVQLADFGVASTGFKVNTNSAKKMETQRILALRDQRRLILVLDLDQTVLHTISGKHEGENVHFFSHGNFSTFLRPHLQEFLQQIKERYEIFVYTMGTRPYAEIMCGLIDPKHTLFRQRIISKDDASGTSKSLRQLLPSDDSMMIILDDSEEVWPNCPNLIVADKFLFFGQHHEEVLRFNNTNDVFLKFMARMLLEVHEQFYGGLEDIKEILSIRKKTLLSDCVIVFSGVFTLDERPETQPLWQCAVAHGATCKLELDTSVTHLVAEVDGTKKTKRARRLGVTVVHRLWLVLSVMYWHKLPTEQFALERVAQLQGPQLDSEADSRSPQPEKKAKRNDSPE